MIGGLMKTTSRLALVAATGLFVATGSWSLTAKAADLGGDCCSDLEERVAELEATTVRKGNRKVSLELSGQVDRALMFWNDGKNSDVYSVDNSYSSTRFRLKGGAQMAPGWKAGFYQEVEFLDSTSNGTSQAAEATRGTDSSTGSLRLRQSNAFVESDKFGRVTVGLQNAATKDVTLINLGGSLSDAQDYWATSFKVRASNGAQSTVNWGNLWNALDSSRFELARYDSPSIFGFILSASWGQNDFWDMALRYQKEWNSIRVAAGVGYAWYGENFCAANGNVATNGTCTPVNEAGGQVIQGPAFPVRGIATKTEVWSGSASVMHVPTGLYADFAAGSRHLDNPANTGVPNKDATYWYVQAGITKRFFDVGATTLFGEYGDYNNFGVGVADAAFGLLSSTDTTRWGVGFTQAFDRAALELYANYQHMDADLTGTNTRNGSPEAMDIVYTGARLKF